SVLLIWHHCNTPVPYHPRVHRRMGAFPSWAVILSPAAGSRSEASAESKGPVGYRSPLQLREGITTTPTECVSEIAGRMPCGLMEGAGAWGVVRLRSRC